LNLPHFYIYDASAGSGKTYTITREYLSILLKQDKVFAFQNILAITFTNKAAAEMKQRIIKALVYFAGLETEESHESLLDDVVSQTHLSKQEIKKKSLQILKYLIPNYAGFEVSTIDSFNHRIIRTFAKDLKLVQNFEIDLDTQPYIKQAIENLIEDVGYDKELTEWLVDFVQYKINRDKSGNIRLDLEDYAKLVLNEINYEALETLQQYNLKELKENKYQLQDKIKSIKQEIIATAEKFFKLIDSEGIEEKNFKGKYIPKYFRKLIGGEVQDKFESGWHNIKETDFYTKTQSLEITEKIDSIRPEIEDIFLKSKSLCIEYHLSEKVLKSFVPLSMISEIQKRINHIKTEEGILFVNDFNRIISKHIKHQPVPFIYERLGEKFRHYFIDEFQDTSKLQWENLMPLVDNAITAEHSDGNSGSLYLVGDVKQSIYEWRGGDPKQFLDLSQDNSNPFSIKAEKITLENNWRSSKTIVEFNNGFFNHAADYLTDPKHQHLYKNATQKHKKDLEGYVDIRFLKEQEDKSLMDNQRILSLQGIIESVKSQGNELRDICILVRKNRFGTAIAEAFNDLENPIPVVSQESLLIASDVKVQLLTQFLKLVENYEPEHSIDFILSWFNYTHYDEALYHEALVQLKHLDYHVFFDHLKHYCIDFETSIYENLSLYDKAEYVLRALDMGADANAYIQFFLDEVFEFSTSSTKSMSDFLEYWNDQKSNKSISTSESQNAVNIMTIHKSKGLEFPVVIYAHANFKLADLSKTEDWVSVDENKFGVPFVYDNISKNSKTLSSSFEEVYHHNVSKQELASLNAAYVCMTRAVEQLYILSEPIRTRSVTFENILVGYLKHTGQYEDEKEHYVFGKQKSKVIAHSQNNIPNQSNFESYPAQYYYSSLTADNHIKEILSGALEYGREVHDYLQKIETINDVEKHHITHEVRQLLKEVINHHDLAGYFTKDWTIYNETDIIFNGALLRPDRVCLKNKEAVIIDYKTGKEDPSHLKQLTNYKEALEAMDYSVEKAYLVYIRKNIYVKSL